MYPAMVTLRLITILVWLFFWLSFKVDRSRYRNCLLLGLAILLTVPSVCSLAGEHYQRIMVMCMVIFALCLLVVPFILIADGIVMFRREGLKLANMLSLVLGIVIGAGELATYITTFGYAFTTPSFMDAIRPHINLAIALFSITVIYVSSCVLLFVLYSVFLQIIPRKKDFDYVIIHGAGLIDGREVSKLLSDRLDKAIEVYRRDPTPPILIPSGGKGSDEDISEAEAMAEYLKDHGIPEEMILMEDESATTFENLRNSKEIIDAREGDRYTTLVTSNYHVFRALRYCRQLDFACTGIGSRVALYYWPSAVIREFIAIHYEKKHAIIFAVGWVACLFMPMLF